MLSMFGVLAMSQSVLAAQCPEEYTAEKVQSDLQAATAALKSNDSKGLKAVTTGIESNITCMKTPAPPQVFGTLYRLIGVGYYKSKDEANAKRWLSLAVELDPGYQWSFEEIAQNDPFRPFYANIRSTTSLKKVEVPEKAIDIDSGTKLWLDGRKLTEAAATVDRPHVLLLANSDDRVVQERHLIEGNAIPDKYLGEIQEPKNSGSADIFAVTKVQRERPRGKTPLLILGGATLAASAGMYGATFGTNAQFQDAVKSAKPSSELESIRAKNNTLVVSSLLLGGVGAGLTFTGVMLDGSPGMTFAWHY